ncbi:phosphate permease, partial [Helicobacter pylori]
NGSSWNVCCQLAFFIRYCG